MPKKNSPGCRCCADPFCCNGTPPTTITLTITGVTGAKGGFGGSNPMCADDCAASYNRASGVTLTRAGNSCSWGLDETVEKVCGNPSEGCSTEVRSYRLRIYEDPQTNDWIIELMITGAYGGVHYEFNNSITQPNCGTLTEVLTLVDDSTCCTWTTAIVDIA